MFTDGRHRDEGIKAWLNSYHSTEPFVSCLDHVNGTTKSTALPSRPFSLYLRLLCDGAPLPQPKLRTS